METPLQPPRTFKEELESLINKYGQEKRSNTPDFILADFMDGCLRSFEAASLAREDWYGKRNRPGQRD